MSATGGRGLGAAHGAAGSGAMHSLRGQEKPPPLMDPSRERDQHRILRLFGPYKWRLAGAMLLIAFSAGLSMVSPFLLREVINVGLIQHNSTVLAECVGGMIAIAIATAVFSVWQADM